MHSASSSTALPANEVSSRAFKGRLSARWPKPVRPLVPSRITFFAAVFSWPDHHGPAGAVCAGSVLYGTRSFTSLA